MTQSWNNYPDRHIAETELTERELISYRLHHQGLSYRTIAIALDLSVSTVRDRIKNSRRKILRAKARAA